MGEGDRKPSYQPNHKRVRCVRCGNAFVDVAVRRCRHPAVVARFGDPAYVCIYCCRRKPCPEYGTEYGGLSTCALRKEKQ